MREKGTKRERDKRTDSCRGEIWNNEEKRNEIAVRAHLERILSFASVTAENDGSDEELEKESSTEKMKVIGTESEVKRDDCDGSVTKVGGNTKDGENTANFEKFLRSFRNEDRNYSMTRAPTEIDTTTLPQFVAVGTNKRSVSYVGNGRDPHDVGSVRANTHCPLDRNVYYYEVRIDNAGVKGAISIGLTARVRTLNCYPGWENDSFGYRASDGAKMNGGARGEPYGASYSTSDVVGCGIDFVAGEIFFTKNGTYLGAAFVDVASASRLYPSVGMHSADERVTLNFDSNFFRFDIDAFIERRRTKILRDVRDVHVDPSLLSELVESYLRVHGYERTLKDIFKITIHRGKTNGEAANSRHDDGVEENSRRAKYSDEGSGRGIRTISGERSAIMSSCNAAGKFAIAVSAEDSGASDANAKPRKPLDPVFLTSTYLRTVNTDATFGSLALRTSLRHAIVCGRCEEAIKKIRQSDCCVGKTLSSNSDAIRRLRRQHFIELVREGRVAEAVQLARNEKRLVHQTAPLSSVLSATASTPLSKGDKTRKLHLGTMERLCGLLAYENPLNSPLSHLLNSERRLETFDAVNETILSLTTNMGSAISPLECVLRHLDLAVSETMPYQ